MKTLKLKSIKNGVIAMGILFFFVTSCNREETIEPVPEASQEELALQLEADPDFATLKALDTELFNQVAVVLQEKGLTGDDVNRMYQSNEMGELQEIFGNDKIASIMAEVTLVNERLYSSYSQLISEGDVADYELRAMEGFSGLEQTAPLDSRWCGWKYYACKGAAYAARAACISGTSGWGTVGCYIAYYGASRWCKSRYC